MHRTLLLYSIVLTALLAALLTADSPVQAQQPPPEGFRALFNGKDLEGWYGNNPHTTSKASEGKRKESIAAQQAEFKKHWSVENGELVNDGHGPYATTSDDLGDIEFHIEYKTVAKADSGIYLRGTPQVQIWDYTDPGKFKIGGDKGSGGLWNNGAGHPGKDPLVLADKPFGEWNSFRIRQIGARTTVYLNDKLVVDNAVMDNYWNRKLPLPAKGPIHLQTHGGEIRWRNIFVRDIPAEEANAILREKAGTGFVSVFNGKDFAGWKGPVQNYEIHDGALVCKPGKGGTIYTEDEYGDFVVQMEFKLPPGGNNGLAIRYPGQGDTAYVGMCELQILDSEHPKYAKLDDRQFHGSAYGMVAAQRGYLRPTGEWNFQQVTVRGSRLTVELNGNVILDADLSMATDFMGKRPHPGKDRTRGHFGFAGHSDPVEFRNVRIKSLDGRQ